MIIAVDVDEVVADLTTPWLAQYNASYGDSLTPSHIKSWDIHKFCKPECGKKIYDYLNADIYDYVNPIWGALSGIESLRSRNHRVIFVTSAHSKIAGVKFEWLLKHKFLCDRSDFGVNYIECRDKYLINAAVLIDDGFHNVRAFPRTGILFTQPWNFAHHWDFRVDGWADILGRIE